MEELLKNWQIIASLGSSLILFGKIQQQIKEQDKRLSKTETKQEEQDKAINQVKVDTAEIRATTKAIYDNLVRKP